MKIILNEEVQGLGYQGDLVEVKDGYARNFLFPQGIAIPANKENLAIWEANKEEIQAKRQAAEEKAKGLKDVIDQTVLTITTKAGEEGKIFGSVTSQDIADAFNRETGEELDKKKIVLEENIKSIGKHTVMVKVFPEINAELRIRVQNEDGDLIADEEDKEVEAAPLEETVSEETEEVKESEEEVTEVASKESEEVED